MRGCITNGQEWLFFVYEKKKIGDELSYMAEPVKLGENYQNLPLILGVLRDWVCVITFFNPVAYSKSRLG